MIPWSFSRFAHDLCLLSYWAASRLPCLLGLILGGFPLHLAKLPFNHWMFYPLFIVASGVDGVGDTGSDRLGFRDTGLWAGVGKIWCVRDAVFLEECCTATDTE